MTTFLSSKFQKFSKKFYNYLIYNYCFYSFKEKVFQNNILLFYNRNYLRYISRTAIAKEKHGFNFAESREKIDDWSLVTSHGNKYQNPRDPIKIIGFRYYMLNRLRTS